MRGSFTAFRMTCLGEWFRITVLGEWFRMTVFGGWFRIKVLISGGSASML
jgi:hypothetical protein